MKKPTQNDIGKAGLDVKRAAARAALARIRAKARADGLDKLTMDQIDAIMAEARREQEDAD